MKSLFKILWINLSLRRKKQTIGLIFFSILTSLFEVYTVGSVFNLLSSLTNTGKKLSTNIPRDFSFFMNFDYNTDSFFILFIFFLILACVCRIILLWSLLRFSHTIGNDMGTLMFLKILKQPMEYHFSTTTSEIISGLTKKIQILSLEIIHPIILVLSNMIIILGVLGYLVLNIGLKAFLIFIMLIFIFYIFWKISKSKIMNNSKIISKNSDEVVKIISETLSAIKLISMKQIFIIFSERFGKINKKLKFAEGDNVFLSQSIRIWLELFIIIFGTIFCFVALKWGVLLSILPIIGGMIFGVYRIIPLILKAYSGVTTIMGAKESFKDILNFLLLDETDFHHIQKDSNINFSNEIVVENLFYRYPSKKVASLKNINCKIKKNKLTAIIGKTGSGKTTLISLICGLIFPAEGKILIDQKNLYEMSIIKWQNRISYVPQETIIIDGSVSENISMILDHKIDKTRLIQVLKMTKLEKFIPFLDSKEIIGERGVRISVGERQRIGLARALYDDKEIIILDEPFSALDKLTAKEILLNIKNQKKFTVLIVTHDKFVVPFCDDLIKLNNGQLFK